ncbi:MAG: transglycosylase SLT domain-containing protein [Chitinivibrionales bacterium]|nr:transglycosylase SLT domain-containing protein [Chitinivibrionales bacterium]
MKYVYLEITQGIEQGRRYQLRVGPNTIGRNPSNNICIHPDEKFVSTQHAIIYFDSEDSLLIQDIKSRNGTYINDSKVISQQDISFADLIGFGKTGPRLRLICSDEELPPMAEKKPKPVVQSATAPQSNETALPTGDNQSGVFSMGGHKPRELSNGEEADSDRTPIPSSVNIFGDDDDGYGSSGDDNDENNEYGAFPAFGHGSMTMEISNKIIRNELSPQEFNKLIQNERRVKKILGRSDLDHSRKTLLNYMFQLGKNSRKRWLMVISILTSLFIIIVAGLSVQMFQYRDMLKKGLSLEDQLDAYEKRIFEANRNPEQNQEELGRLITEFDMLNQKLSTVKGNIRNDDQQKFYTNETERFIDDLMKRFGETNYHIPPAMVEPVEYHIVVYSTNLKSKVTRYMKRKDLYMPMIRNIFLKNSLPEELGYIAMLESGFNPRALSSAGARGLWQFMPQTGRQFGLRVDEMVDERCDAIKSTYAAAEYFKDLIGIFGGKSSVMFAMAAYNAGEGRVIGALRKIANPIKDRDFWYIYRMGYLAEETNEYIPRVLAMMIIDKDPRKYGFDLEGTDTTGSQAKENDLVDVGIASPKK